MIWILAILLCVPGTALIGLKQRGWSPAEALRLGLLTLVCLGISGPFINDQGLGTGEATNYSLAVADTVIQARAGLFPVHVGQTEYAFNGRVHPLRTAVYFTHVPALLDAITFRQLSFWGLQNLSLALSLWLGVFVLYGCLRRAVSQTPWLSFALAMLFGSSPGLLAPAYGMDLYMTVTAAPFVVLAIFGATQSYSARTFSSYGWMAIGLAGTWLAHPPVAAWTSFASLGIVGVSWLTQRPCVSAALNLLVAGVLGALLSAWAFASALSLREGIIDASPANLVSELVTATTGSVGWAGLLPVRAGGTELGDYQLGYAGWALFFTAVLVALRRGTGVVRALVGVTVFLLVLTLPIPVLHERLWQAMPPAFGMLTNSWPMQRAYLLLATIVIFSFALSWLHVAPLFVAGHKRRRQAWAVIALLCVWTVMQAWSFVSRGYFTRDIATRVAPVHQSSNIDLTGIAYAFMKIPRQFYHGTRDPEQELRLLAPDAIRTVALNEGPPSQAGALWVAELRTPAGDSSLFQFEPTVILEPGRRYRLKFQFGSATVSGVLVLKGSHGLYRQYLLPGSERGLGFGMYADNRRELVLWTDSPEAERISFALATTDSTAVIPEAFASLELFSFDRAALPFRLISLAPSLVVEADITEDGWLETPRMFVAGYAATVDGVAVVPRRSPDGQTLIPVTAGHRRIEMSYVPSDLLRRSSFISLSSWTILAAIGLCWVLFKRLPHRPARGASVAWQRITIGLTLSGGAFTAIWLFAQIKRELLPTQQAEPGPLTLELALPVDAVGKAEPLVSSGEGPGSVTLFVRYDSASTIRLGIDVWGYGPRESNPLPIDYAKVQTIRLTSGLLYDRAEKALLNRFGLEPTTWLQKTTQFWLNDQEVFFISEPPRSKVVSPFGVLRSVTGDGSYQHRFSGVRLSANWGPVRADLVPLPTTQQLKAEYGPIKLTVLLSALQIGQAEPLISVRDTAGGTCLFIHYLDATHARVGLEGPNSTLVTSAPFAVDYTKPLTIALSHSAFYPQDSSVLAGYSPYQRLQLLQKTRVAVNDRWVLTGHSVDADKTVSGPVRFGLNTVGATYPLPAFSGRFLASGRMEAKDWPLGPGNPEAAFASGTAGPIEITVRLPEDMYGRQQPIFVAGKAGEGVLVIVHYLDRDHIRVGVDVWNKALFWSEPIPTDYQAPQRIQIAMTSLFPTDHFEVEALPQADRDRRRNTLSVAVNEATVISETIFAYDSHREQMTPGRSNIGGSNNEAAFQGDILDVKRLPFASP